MSALLMKKCDIHRVSKFEGFKVFFEGVKLVYFQFTYDGSAEQCTMVGRHIIIIILHNSTLCFILPATWACLEKWGQF